MLEFSRSSSKLGRVRCQFRAARVWVLDAAWSMAKIGPNGPKFSPGPGFGRQAQSAADDRRYVAYRVALVGDGVPRRPGRCRFQGQPEQDSCVEGVHGRPTLGAVARVAGHTGASRLLGEQAGEAAPALVVDRARHADGAGAHPA